MGNCLFLKTDDKNVKTPRNIKDAVTKEAVLKENIEAVLDPLQPIDLVIDETVPQNVAHHLRKKDSEYSLESPYSNTKSPINQTQTQKMENMKRKEKKKNKIIANEDSAEGQKIFEKFTKVNRKIQEKDIYLIIKSLRSHFLFFDLSENELENIVPKMFYCEVDEKQCIFQQGDNASSYFIVDHGSLEIIINNDVKRVVKEGEGFGELALLFNAPRSASVRAAEKCGLWAIDRNTFRKAVEEMSSKQCKENRKFMENVNFFQNLTGEQKDSIASVLTTQKFKKGEYIVVEGDPASSFYVIKSGEVAVLKGDKEIRKMEKGDSFGEQALYYNTVRSCSVRADGEVRCLALGREVLTKILGAQIQVITFKNIMKWAFEKNKALMKLTQIQIEKVIELMEIVQVKKGDVVMNKNEVCQKFLILLEGTMEMKNGSENVVVSKGMPFGQDYLSEKSCEKKLPEDLIATSDAIVAGIKISSFLQCIGGSWDNAVRRNEKSHERTILQIGPSNHLAGKAEIMSLKLEDMIMIKKLGFGQFGSVYLVRNKENKKFYALKCISKLQILEQSLERHLAQEKSVLELIDFPFIMKFVRSFRDETNIYFLVEYVRGMELFDVIRDIGLLKNYDSQFYIGSILLGLEYLHARSIIYRDIKPENIMVDDGGYLKMIDMGTAKILSGKAGGRTFTIIGTPHYMAPEIITGKGYSFSVDLWSVGICLYEFICGEVPFAEDAEDPYEIYEEIIKKPIVYPSFIKDKKVKKIIDQLLSKVPELRLGGSYAALKGHSWFNNFDWDKLFNKELKPPYMPPKNKIISDEDIKKFEDMKRLVMEEIKNDPKYVSKKQRPIEPKDPNWDHGY